MPNQSAVAAIQLACLHACLLSSLARLQLASPFGKSRFPNPTEIPESTSDATSTIFLLGGSDAALLSHSHPPIHQQGPNAVKMPHPPAPPPPVPDPPGASPLAPPPPAPDPLAASPLAPSGPALSPANPPPPAPNPLDPAPPGSLPPGPQPPAPDPPAPSPPGSSPPAPLPPASSPPSPSIPAPQQQDGQLWFQQLWPPLPLPACSTPPTPPPSFLPPLPRPPRPPPHPAPLQPPPPPHPSRALHILKTYTGSQPSLTQLRQECVNDEAFDGDADMAWVFRSVYAIREQAVMEAMDAFLATKRRGSGELKFRKKRALFGTLRLPAKQWKGGFQKTYEYWEGGIEVSTEMWSGGEILGLKDEGGQPFGFVAAEEPVSATWEGGGSLSWENGVWYLMVPFVSGKPSDVAEGHRICAIDPGIRTFATVYDPLRQKAFQWGTGRDVKVLFDVALKIDNLLGKMHAPDIRHRARYRMKRAVNRYRMRLRHLVMEIHKKFALWLSKNYDTVLLPSLSAHGISARGRRKIRKSTVRQMFSWAHGKFRDRLSNKISFVEIKEHYTSRTCSQCGADNPRLGGKSVFRCPSPACGLEADRDVNAAKKIFLKWLHDFHQDASFACKLRRRQ
ncbi:hypothetical protein A4X09_0g4124 [Tilletia walkeri]|uniref:Cas12f1-like TNB domain-containing protein n=1 Tax=Tilletia walkeri TaxID=117179 RepID=A0A8X7N7Q2_9BASI|nr:hypothetical protein A4X09_0g4124 [Tilletia walkeri]